MCNIFWYQTIFETLLLVHAFFISFSVIRFTITLLTKEISAHRSAIIPSFLDILFMNCHLKKFLMYYAFRSICLLARHLALFDLC